ncbi:hypothetical protein KAT63_02035 [Candidatus Parcubacteria bacterium]|nr:hypothetical protein [Candidatus Parcubacteria bacterium]
MGRNQFETARKTKKEKTFDISDLQKKFSGKETIKTKQAEELNRELYEINKSYDERIDDLREKTPKGWAKGIETLKTERIIKINEAKEKFSNGNIKSVTTNESTEQPEVETEKTEPKNIESVQELEIENERKEEKLKQLNRDLAKLRREKEELGSPSLKEITGKRIEEIEKEIRALEESSGIFDEKDSLEEETTEPEDVKSVQEPEEEKTGPENRPVINETENEIEEEKWDELKDNVYEILKEEYEKSSDKKSYTKKIKNKIRDLTIENMDPKDKELLDSFNFKIKSRENKNEILTSYKVIGYGILSELEGKFESIEKTKEIEQEKPKTIIAKTEEEDIEKNWKNLEDSIKGAVEEEFEDGSSLREVYENEGKEKARESVKNSIDEDIKSILEDFKLEDNKENRKRINDIIMGLFDELLDKIEKGSGVQSIEAEGILEGSENNNEKYYELERERLEKMRSFLNEEKGEKIESNWKTALTILYEEIGSDYNLPDSLKAFNVHKKSEDSVLVCLYYENEIYYDIDIDFKENGINVAVEKNQAVQTEQPEILEKIPNTESEEDVRQMSPEKLDKEIEKIKKYLEDIEKEADGRSADISKIDKYQEFEEYLGLLISAKKIKEGSQEDKPEEDKTGEKPAKDKIKEPKKFELNEARKESLRKTIEIEKLRKENKDILSIPWEDLTDEERKIIERIEELEIGIVLDESSAIFTDHVRSLEEEIGKSVKEGILGARERCEDSFALLNATKMLKMGLEMKMQKSKKQRRTFPSVGKLGNAVKNAVRERLKDPFKKKEKAEKVKTISGVNEMFSRGKRKDLNSISEQGLANEFETVLEDIHCLSPDFNNKTEEIIKDAYTINIKNVLRRINAEDDIENKRRNIELFFEKSRIKIEKLPDDLNNPKEYLNKMLSKVEDIFKEKIRDKGESIRTNENQTNEQQDSDSNKFKIEIIEQLKNDEKAVQELGALVGFASFVNEGEKIGKLIKNGMEDSINNKKLKELLEKEGIKDLAVKEVKEIYDELKTYRDNLDSDQNDETEDNQVEIETAKKLEISRILLSNGVKTKDLDKIIKILELKLNKVSSDNQKLLKVVEIKDKINNEKHRQIIENILNKDKDLSIIDLKNIIEDVKTKK